MSRYPETKDELKKLKKAWSDEEARLYQAFKASLTPEQLAMLQRYQQAGATLAKVNQRLAMYDRPTLRQPATQAEPLEWPENSGGGKG